MKLDNFDRKILHIIQNQADQTAGQIAEQVGLSATPCWRRIKRLEEEGYIARKVMLLHAEKLGLGLIVFATVKLSAHGREKLDLFEEHIKARPEVMECHSVSGQADYIIKIVTHDIKSYDQFLKDVLLKLPAIQEVHSLFSLSTVKYTTALPTDG
ncbi:MAG: Lrp/AsnC family transcriptional regulator [Alphaproteobacteria bacterium]